MKPVDPTDRAFVDRVMAGVHAASTASDEEELFPGGTGSRAGCATASRPGTWCWRERLVRAAFVVAAVLFLALRVSMLGSVLAGSAIDEAPSGVSQSAVKEGDDV